jgi:hypothetical protein
MSPTIFRKGPYRFFFFSKEEAREHVHVESGNGTAKFWLKPAIELSVSYGFKVHELNEIRLIIEEHQQEILDAWTKHSA